jgi:hypothetical protein
MGDSADSLRGGVLIAAGPIAWSWTVVREVSREYTSIRRQR